MQRWIIISIFQGDFLKQEPSMIKGIFLFFCSLLVSQLQAVTQIEIKQQLDKRVADFKKNYPSAGLIIGLIRRDDAVPGKKATDIFSYGGKSINDRTLFPIGSLTMGFTAALFAHYVVTGEMKLDDPAQKYLPKDVFVPKYRTRQMTLLDLATHTSGLPFMPSNYIPGKPYSVNQMYEYLSRIRLLSSPGRKYMYSQLGYALLANILSRAGGDTWQKLVAQEICDKLDMPDTRSELSGEQTQRLITGHYKMGKSENGSFLYPPDSPFIGSKGLFSTMSDMLKWLSFHLGLGSTDLNFVLPIVLEPRRVINISTQSEVSLGWEYAFVGKERAFRRYSMTGREEGSSSFIAFIDAIKTGVVVLANADYPTDLLGLDILNMIHHLEEKPLNEMEEVP